MKKEVNYLSESQLNHNPSEVFAKSTELLEKVRYVGQIFFSAVTVKIKQKQEYFPQKERKKYSKNNRSREIL